MRVSVASKARSNVGELFNSVRHSRAGSSHSSLTVVPCSWLGFIFLRQVDLLFCAFQHILEPQETQIPHLRLSSRDLNLTKSKGRAGLSASTIPTRICATTARVVAAGSPGAWACSHGHQEPRAPSTSLPPTTTAKHRPRPDAVLESTPSLHPPHSREPLLTPSASALGRPRRPQPSGPPRPPPSTPWPRGPR